MQRIFLTQNQCLMVNAEVLHDGGYAGQKVIETVSVVQVLCGPLLPVSLLTVPASLNFSAAC